MPGRTVMRQSGGDAGCRYAGCRGLGGRGLGTDDGREAAISEKKGSPLRMAAAGAKWAVEWAAMAAAVRDGADEVLHGAHTAELVRETAFGVAASSASGMRTEA